MGSAAIPITDHRPLPAFRQALLSFYWFATQVHWSAILVILLPAQARLIGGETLKGTTLGQVLLIGALVSMVVAPVFGAISDRIVTRWGRRRPWLVVGSSMNAIGLVALAAIPSVPGSLGWFIAAFMWIEFWNNVATAPYSALIPDVVPPGQRGAAAGWLGLMTMLGNFAGALAGFALGSVGISGMYLILSAIILIGMLGTVLFTPEPQPPRNIPPFRWSEFLRGLYEPLVRSLDFRWVFLTRFLITMGIFTVQEFLLFYFTDVMRVFNLFGIVVLESAASAVTVFVAMLLVGAIGSTLTAGILSDRYGRKAMVYIASVLQGVVPLAFIFFSNFNFAVILGIVFGLGYGAYQSVDWALATDVLPSTDDYAKDMGVWHVASVFPQVVATPIAGSLLDKFQAVGQANGLPTLGYTIIFMIAVVYFALGTVFVTKIRGVR
jgi:MFS family permease